jgi:hypothetical protein
MIDGIFYMNTNDLLLQPRDAMSADKIDTYLNDTYSRSYL